MTMGVWYAHERSTTLALDGELVGKYSGVVYRERGWPTFESHISDLIKPSDPHSWNRHIHERIPDSGRRRREPPLHPRRFAAELTLRKFTNGREDFWKVSALYEQTLAGALSRIQELKFVGCSWDDCRGVVASAGGVRSVLRRPHGCFRTHRSPLA